MGGGPLLPLEFPPGRGSGREAEGGTRRRKEEARVDGARRKEAEDETRRRAEAWAEAQKALVAPPVPK